MEDRDTYDLFRCWSFWGPLSTHRTPGSDTWKYEFCRAVWSDQTWSGPWGNVLKNQICVGHGSVHGSYRRMIQKLPKLGHWSRHCCLDTDHYTLRSLLFYRKSLGIQDFPDLPWQRARVGLPQDSASIVFRLISHLWKPVESCWVCETLHDMFTRAFAHQECAHTRGHRAKSGPWVTCQRGFTTGSGLEYLESL